MPPKRKSLTFGQAQQEGLHKPVFDREDVPEAPAAPETTQAPRTPSETLRDAQNGKPITVRVGVTVAPRDLQNARRAYVSDQDQMKNPPSSMTQWVNRAIQRHLDRTPAQRRHAVTTAAYEPTPGRKEPYNTTMTPAMRAALNEAVGEERRAGWITSVSGLVREALFVEISASRARAGGELPEVHGRLPHSI